MLFSEARICPRITSYNVCYTKLLRRPEIAARLDGKLSALLDESKRFALEVSRNPMDQETLAMLQALGYLADADQRSAAGGMDPKDGIELYTKLEDARNQAQRGNYAECERLLRELLRNNFV